MIQVVAETSPTQAASQLRLARSCPLSSRTQTEPSCLSRVCSRHTPPGGSHFCSHTLCALLGKKLKLWTNAALVYVCKQVCAFLIAVQRSSRASPSEDYVESIPAVAAAPDASHGLGSPWRSLGHTPVTGARSGDELHLLWELQQRAGRCERLPEQPSLVGRVPAAPRWEAGPQACREAQKVCRRQHRRGQVRHQACSRFLSSTCSV